MSHQPLCDTRVADGYDSIIKVCKAFGKVAMEHIAEYGESCDISAFEHLDWHSDRWFSHIHSFMLIEDQLLLHFL